MVNLLNRRNIKSGDIVLFYPPKFPGFGWWIARLTASIYSHVGLCNWESDGLYVYEFVAKTGIRKIRAAGYLDIKAVDLYRVAPELHKWEKSIGGENLIVGCYSLTSDKIRRIMAEAQLFVDRKLGYGNSLIVRFIKMLVPVIRLFARPFTRDEDEPKAFVCSTFVSYLYRKHHLDLVDNLSDSDTKPGDLARSPLLTHVLSIRP